jgi:DNA-binding NtrC family response regulator
MLQILQSFAQRPTVLVVDDDSAQREILSEFLTDAGVGVALAKDGREGLQILQTQPIAVALTDIYMPAMGGLELLQTAHANGRAPVFIVATGSDSAPLVMTAVRGGAVEFLQKPFNRADLTTALERALAVAARREALARLLAEIRSCGGPEVAARVTALEALLLGDLVAHAAFPMRS